MYTQITVRITTSSATWDCAYEVMCTAMAL